MTYATVLLTLVALGQPLVAQANRDPRTRSFADAPRTRSMESRGPAPRAGGDRRSTPMESRGARTRDPEAADARPQPKALPRESPAGLIPEPLAFYPGTRIVRPRPWEVLRVAPDARAWEQRDLLREMQWMSREGLIPVTPVDLRAESFTDVSEFPAGWRAYGIAIPAGGKVQVEVSHPNLGWFRLMVVNRHGQVGPGMLPAAAAYRPIMVTVSNPGTTDDAVYIIVDDPGHMSSKDAPYTISVRRDWDPETKDLSKVQLVSGIWGASPSVSAQFRRPSISGPAVYPH